MVVNQCIGMGRDKSLPPGIAPNVHLKNPESFAAGRHHLYVCENQSGIPQKSESQVPDSRVRGVGRTGGVAGVRPWPLKIQAALGFDVIPVT